MESPDREVPPTSKPKDTQNIPPMADVNALGERNLQMGHKNNKKIGWCLSETPLSCMPIGHCHQEFLLPHSLFGQVGQS